MTYPGNLHYNHFSQDLQYDVLSENSQYAALSDKTASWRPDCLGVVLVDHSLDEAALFGALAGVVLGAVPAVGLGHGTAGLEVDGSCDPDHLGDLVVTDETSGGFGVLCVDVDGAVHCLAHGGKHLELDIADGIDGVRAEYLEHLCGAGVAMSGMGGNLEMAVLRDLACLAHLVQDPQAALVIDEEASTAEPGGALDVFDSPDDLFLSAQAVTHPDALFGVDGGGGVGRRPGSDGEDQIGLPLVGELNHLADLRVGQAHDTLGLGDTVEIKPIIVHGFEKGAHDLGALDAGNLKAVLAAVLKALLRIGQVIGVAAGETGFFQEFSGFIHTVHGFSSFSFLWSFLVVLYRGVF